MVNLEGEALLRAFANFDLNINNATIQVFLMVAHRGECAQKELELELGLSDASSSRNVSFWTDDIDKKGRRGWGLIERRENPEDRRYKLLRLTPEGQQFFAKLQASRDGRMDGWDFERPVGPGNEKPRRG